MNESGAEALSSSRSRCRRGAALRRHADLHAPAASWRTSPGSTSRWSASRSTAAPPTAPGARHGPREIRNQSSLMRRVHHVSGIAPYDPGAHRRCAATAPSIPIDLMDALAKITAFFGRIRDAGAIPIDGGRRPSDHLADPACAGERRRRSASSISTPIPIPTTAISATIRITHGTPFRRAIEEGLLDPARMIQIGIRGSIYDPSDYDFAKANGIRVIFIEEFARRGVEEVVAEIRAARRWRQILSVLRHRLCSIRHRHPAPARRKSAA